MFRKLLDSAKAGDNVGVLLRGTKKEEVERGMVLAKPGSITPHMNFKAEVYVLSKDEGGRHTPFFTNYRPQFYFRTTDVTGTVSLPAGRGNGDAGRQRIGRCQCHCAGRHGKRPAVRYPRRRPDHRRRTRQRRDRLMSRLFQRAVAQLVE